MNFSISTSAIKDVRNSYDNRNMSILEQKEWIYTVDTETMDEVKALWRVMNGTSTLFNAFWKIVKHSQKLNIKF